METKKCESCSNHVNYVFSCSGAADVGELSDKVARQLNKTDLCNMYCMAGLGGDVPPIVANTRGADKVLALDGCHVHCVKKTLDRLGITDYIHFDITQNGFTKGETIVNEESISAIFDKCKDLMEH